jgi:hypothetical protein
MERTLTLDAGVGAISRFLSDTKGNKNVNAQDKYSSELCALNDKYAYLFEDDCDLPSYEWDQEFDTLKSLRIALQSKHEIHIVAEETIED